MNHEAARLSAADLVGLLAEADRRNAFAALVLGARSVPEIVTATGLKTKAVLAALQKLVDGGLVSTDGQRETYELVEDVFGASTPEHSTEATADETRERFHTGGSLANIVGIGGFFFQAQDPDHLSDWYAEHLHVLRPPTSYDAPVWTQTAGPTVFAPFGDDGPNEHLGPSGWGLNLRVDDLDGVVERLRGAGLDVTVDPETYPNGRFASLHDPEGNPVQLWQVAGH